VNTKAVELILLRQLLSRLRMAGDAPVVDEQHEPVRS
jgi:hypothetical protein